MLLCPPPPNPLKACSAAPASSPGGRLVASSLRRVTQVKLNGVVVADEAGDDGFSSLDVLIEKSGDAADGFVVAPHGQRRRTAAL